jgi:hypothetical protein
VTWHINLRLGKLLVLQNKNCKIVGDALRDFKKCIFLKKQALSTIFSFIVIYFSKPATSYCYFNIFLLYGGKDTGWRCMDSTGHYESATTTTNK